jgi:lon-related putative ATP-dependent protease
LHPDPFADVAKRMMPTVLPPQHHDLFHSFFPPATLAFNLRRKDGKSLMKKLAPENLRRSCSLEKPGFTTTDDLDPLEEIIGHPRAVEAVRFGVSMRGDAHNIFAIGPSGIGKNTFVRDFLKRRAPTEPTPDDLCYANNFDQPHKPTPLMLPAGKGRKLREAMEKLVDDVARALTDAFESEDYQQQRQQLEEENQQQQKQDIEQLREKANEQGLTVVQAPDGIGLVPLKKDGSPMPPQEIQQLPEDERKKIEKRSEPLQKAMQDIMRRRPRAQREAGAQLKELNRRIARQALEPLINDLKKDFEEIDSVSRHLDAVLLDMVEKSQELQQMHQLQQVPAQAQQQAMMQQGQQAPEQAQLDGDALRRRYRINLLVENEEGTGAPVVYEDHPTHQNLVGRIEQEAHMGALITDFNLIKPGTLHTANGGYLVLEAHRLLTQPMVWEALKRALRAGRIRIESMGHELGLISTVQLEPESVPLKLSVFLLGDRLLYELLFQLDPDFAELFKVPADFEEHMERSEEDQRQYARLVATIVKKDGLKPFERTAVERAIEFSARLAGDAQKLSVQVRRIADLLQEADHWADTNGNATVTAEDFRQALDSQRYRSSRMIERARKEIHRGTLLIDTDGEVTGQVNGLAVTTAGDHTFGLPHRITARVRLGKGDVIDIEREVELGDPSHTKGVLILAGYLSGRYARRQPLSLSASLVFEQSYAGIAGDSASAGELCALLSAIAEVPVRQGIAITGSVNQHGRMQAIGAVTEKIEGFFEVCKEAGFTGDQGVVIPKANASHLMLGDEVVEAVREGNFNVWVVETVEEAIELLTGTEAGEKDASGGFPEGTINGKVSSALAEMADLQRRFHSGAHDSQTDRPG